MTDAGPYWGNVAGKLSDLQAEINAAGMGDPRDRQIAELRAEVEVWKQRAHDEDTHRRLAAEAAEEFRAENERLHAQVMETARECGIQKTENERLRLGLQQIIEVSGAACAEMETCSHKGCNGSIAAHLLALAVLHPHGA